MAKDIHIMNHVWIAPKSVIMKGAVVGDGCVIGQYSLVNKQIPKNCLAVGMPAKVVKENIRWTREDVLK
jgi:acetyltransferase-like isoleucine patch superfamily enzyme